MIITRRRLDSDALYKRFESTASCSHAKKEVRKRRIKGDTTIFQIQCPQCGEKFGGALSKEKFSEREQAAMPDWNDALAASFQKNKTARWAQIKEEEEAKINAEWQAAHANYIASPAWRLKRDAVILRAHGICEGCRQNKASEVHHLIYDHLGDEFLFELVAICRPCHERYHEKSADSVQPAVNTQEEMLRQVDDDEEDDCPF